MILIGIIAFFIGLEIFGIILAIVGLFFFPKSSTTSTLDSFIDDDEYYENNSKSDAPDSSDSDSKDEGHSHYTSTFWNDFKGSN